MRHDAEIFDKFQYLYNEMGFSDHQIRCVIEFDGKVDADAMRRASALLVGAVPILSRKYIDLGAKSYWEDQDCGESENIFRVVDRRDEFDRFTCSKPDESHGPQIRFCLLQGETDSLSVLINHMVSDAGGLKQCMYLFAEIYSGLIKDPGYAPGFTIDGDRGFENVVHTVAFPKRAELLLFGRKDNNQPSSCEFPVHGRESALPFLASCELPREKYHDIRDFCHKNGYTLNDVIMTAYFRALSETLGMNGRELSVPIMIDMRRYLDDKSFRALTNLASTSIVRMDVKGEEDFGSTLIRVSSVMKAKKADHLGMNTFIKLDAGFKVPLVNAYRIMKKVLKNPKISMTNIGILDPSKMVFGNTAVKNAVMYASIKYCPYFQISVTSFGDRLTLGSGLYGDAQDREKVEKLLNLVSAELQTVGV